ncbi:MAG: lysoplasmalogenase [Propioniciclava sp.]
MSAPATPRLGWALYAATVTVHLGFQLVAPDQLGSRVSQILLAPILLALLLRSVDARNQHLGNWTMAALQFCFLGDLLPGVVGGDAGFLAMVGAFLGAQVCFCVAFWPYRAASFLGARRGWLLGYAAALAALMVVVGPDAGALIGPVVVYGLTLTLMAVLASGLGPLGAWGGALFLVSDALVAIRAFTLDVPASGVVVMMTYAAALGLLVLAVVRRSNEAGTTSARAEHPRHR